MNENSKKFLKIGLIIYIVVTLLHLFNGVDTPILKDVIRLGSFYVSITSIIVIAYAWDKGANDIGKYGVIFFIAHIVLSILNIYIPELIFGNTSVITNVNLYKGVTGTFYVLRTIASSGFTLCGILALFSLINSNNSKIKNLQTAAIVCYIINIGLNIILNFISFENSKTLSTINSVFNALYSIFEYSMIVLYLLDKVTKKDEIVSDTNNHSVAVNPTIVQAQPQILTPSFTIQNPTTQPVTQPNFAIQNSQTQQAPSVVLGEQNINNN